MNFSGYCDPIESGWSSQNLLNYESASDLVDGLCASIEGDSALYFMYRIQSSSGLVITTTFITLTQPIVSIHFNLPQESQGMAVEEVPIARSKASTPSATVPEEAPALNLRHKPHHARTNQKWC